MHVPGKHAKVASVVQVERARAEASAFAQASHVFWGVWAVLQAKYSSIEFDYFSYSSLRWARFHACMADAKELVDQTSPNRQGQ
jgi:hypothetical protein